jgi:hypothetical protein
MRRPVLGFVQIVDALGDGKALFRPHAEARLASALAARQSILDSAETTPYSNLETQYQNAVWAVGEVRDLGDLIIASSFQEDKRKDRLRRRNELINAFEESRVDIVSESISSLRAGKRGVTPFHWETEFPEVFAGLGFNAIVGNPPFLGGTMISTNLGGRYLDWLTSTFEETGNRTDTRDTGVVARELMRQASKSLLITTYSLSAGSAVFEPVNEALGRNPNLDVTIVLNVDMSSRQLYEREAALTFSRRFWSSQWPWEKRPKVFYDPRGIRENFAERGIQHAKCIVADVQTVFITSANYTEWGQERNIELGALIHDERLAERVSQQFRSLIAKRLLLELPMQR